MRAFTLSWEFLLLIRQFGMRIKKMNLFLMDKKSVAFCHCLNGYFQFRAGTRNPENILL